MAMELRWLASMSASALHAVEAILQRETLVDERLQETLARPVADLCGEMEAFGLNSTEMVPLMAALAMGIENNRELVEVAITKLRGRTDSRGEATGRIAGRVADVAAAFGRTLPGVADQLALRGEPLRQQWEARGPGVLRYFARLTEESLIAGRADVALVYPVLGGHGVAHLSFNTVRIEAVLANPHARLPETVRLAWLLSQLQLDLPIYSEQIPRSRLPYVARLATLPAILHAAEYVELIRAEPSLLAFALQAWRIVSHDEADAVAEVVSLWWRTYEEKGGVPVGVALGSLDRMLREAEVAAI